MPEIDESVPSRLVTRGAYDPALLEEMLGRAPDTRRISGSGAVAAASSPSNPSAVSLTDYGPDAMMGLATLDNDLFGDRVSMATGAINFVQTDIDIPGNFDLPVRFGRRIGFGIPGPASYGGWVPDMPVIVTNQVAVALDLVDDMNRFCSGEMDQPFYIYIPGLDPQSLLEKPSGQTEFPASSTYVTTGNWRVSCREPELIDTELDQEIVAISPTGETYIFTQINHYSQYDPVSDLDRWNGVVLATRAEDVHGNWVDYEYSTLHHPDEFPCNFDPGCESWNANTLISRINASDGRNIEFAYEEQIVGDGSSTQMRLASATSNSGSFDARTWAYSYGQAPSGWRYLNRVTLPDGRYWEFDRLDRLNIALSPDGSDRFGEDVEYAHLDPIGVFELRHPDGVTGSFDVKVVETYAPFEECSMTGCVLTTAPIALFSGLTEKTLDIPGSGIVSWTFNYPTDVTDIAGNNSLGVVSRSVSRPDGAILSYKYNVNGQAEETSWRSLLLLSETLSKNGATLQQTDYTYEKSHSFGEDHNTAANIVTSDEVQRRVSTVSLTRGTAIYTTAYEYEADPLSAEYAYGAPFRITQSSTFQPSESRVTETVFDHNEALWILQQPQTVTRNGKLFDGYAYTTKGQVAARSRFGVQIEQFDYYADGTVWRMSDALGETTSFSFYHRGIPGQIRLPEFITVDQDIDDNGWITRVQDGENTTTRYEYTEGGRLSRINRPTGWDDTTLSYSQTPTGLVQTATRGPLQTITSFDGLLRPTLVEQHAIGRGGTSVFQRRRYDGLGRMVYSSYPSATSTLADARGVETTYDAFGRMTGTLETVTPFATTTTTYNDALNTVVARGPEGFETTTIRSGYGHPDDGEVISIQQPEGIRTDFTHNIWGLPETITQGGQSRTYDYDDTRLDLLCRHSAPELGDTLYAYDLAGRMTAYAEGQPAGSGCAANVASLSGAVIQSYDDLGRMDAMSFPGATPDIQYQYDRNSNLISLTRGTTKWTYAYERLGDEHRLKSEVLEVDGTPYATSYAYASDGARSSMTYPSGLVLEFMPDGFGYPTEAKNAATDIKYASGITYHPNGSLQSLAYGNGLTLNQTLTPRQLLQRRTVSGTVGTALDLSFGYAGDDRAKIQSITDHQNALNNQQLSYDGAGRLASSSGFWGAGDYSYDVLGNLLEKQLGDRRVELEYSSDNRLSRVRDSSAPGGWRTYAYDARGNVIDDGIRQYNYDAWNQQTSITNPFGTTNYVYDGHGMRTKQTGPHGVVLSIYSETGQLLSRQDQTNAKTHDYIFIAGEAVATVLDGDPTYLHTDHLGTPVVQTLPDGTVRSRETWLPFGEAHAEFLIGDGKGHQLGFAGHIEDTGSGGENMGLVYMQARLYDPVIGRFLSNDPVGFVPGRPFTFNRYAYVGNDPANYVDLDGQFLSSIASSGPVTGLNFASLGLQSFLGNVLPGLVSQGSAVSLFGQTFAGRLPLSPAFYQSPKLLRTLIPGQVPWDFARSAFGNGNFGQAALYSGIMLGEQVFTAATFGQFPRIASGVRAGTAASSRFLGPAGPVFGRGGIRGRGLDRSPGVLNNNNYARLGFGWNGQKQVFRAGFGRNGTSNHIHLDLYPAGQIGIGGTFRGQPFGFHPFRGTN